MADRWFVCGDDLLTLPLAPRLWFSLSPRLISFFSLATIVLFLPLVCLAVFLFQRWQRGGGSGLVRRFAC